MGDSRVIQREPDCHDGTGEVRARRRPLGHQQPTPQQHQGHNKQGQPEHLHHAKPVGHGHTEQLRLKRGGQGRALT